MFTGPLRPNRAILCAGLVLLPALLVRAEAWPGRFRINDRGQTRAFVLATNELHVAGRRGPESILPAADALTLLAQAEALGRAHDREVELVLYPEGCARDPYSRRVLTRTVLVQLAPGVDAHALARAVLAQAGPSVRGLPNHYLFTASGIGRALALAEALRQRPGVVAAEPQLARLLQKKVLPNDYYFPEQWHLANTGQQGGTPGVDIHVTNVWTTCRGTNIYIGIVDDGLQYTHPDLAPNVDTTLGYDFNDHDPDPAPNLLQNDSHGTEVAGLAAARGNNHLGVCGVAFEARLVGLRLLGAPTADQQEADAMRYGNSVMHVKNNSWGAEDSPWTGGTLEGGGVLMKAALAEGVATGRGGKGVIYVWSGGNGAQDGEDDNYDGYANQLEVIAVGALNDRGQQPYYSEPGACLTVVAPSGDDYRQAITTTDLMGDDGDNYAGAFDDLPDTSYTKTFNGTSAAAPIVSGVVALMLEANPSLGYRDVREILLRSAARVQPADPDWQTNAAGIAHNHKFGAGLINAAAAVGLATNWAPLGERQCLTLLQSNLSLAIPDNNAAGVVRTFTVTNTGFRVEQLTLTMSAPHAYWGDLAVTVTSPGGIRSRLAETHGYVDTNYAYQGWVFSSVRHWGEKAEGSWTVRVADGAAGYTGELTSLELSLYGTTPKAALCVTLTNDHARLRLQAPAPGWRYDLEVSSDLTAWSRLTSLAILPSGQAACLDTNALALDRRFYRAVLAQP